MPDARLDMTPRSYPPSKGEVLSQADYLRKSFPVPLPTEALVSLAVTAWNAMTRFRLRKDGPPDGRARVRETIERIAGKNTAGSRSLPYEVLASLVVYCLQQAGDAPTDPLTGHRLLERYLPHVGTWMASLLQHRAVDINETRTAGPPYSGHYEALYDLVCGIEDCEDLPEKIRRHAKRAVAGWAAPLLGVTPDAVLRGMRRPRKRT